MKVTSSQPIIRLIKKDILLEIRQQYSLYGMLLYVASTIFIVYLTLGEPEEQVWNALFWLVQLFVCVNAVAKSFLGESRSRMLYYYSIASASEIIIAKLVSNIFLMMMMSALSLLFFLLLLNNPLYNLPAFIGITFLGGIGLSLLFTFLAAIAMKAQQQTALMAIMGFPLIIPQLLLLMKIANTAFSKVLQQDLWQMTFLLIGLDILMVALALILFPFLWKD